LPFKTAPAILEQFMHLQQSKAKSRISGGPQYWFEGMPDHVRGYLQRKKACPVILQTPYGPVETPFVAVDRDYKIVNGKLVRANAQHDRIQKGQSRESIGEAIRRWFALRIGVDFERIEVDVSFDKQSRFILAPLEVKWRGTSRHQTLPSADSPLSFNSRHQSELLKSQIKFSRSTKPEALNWAALQFKNFARHYGSPRAKLASETDLLRLAGAFDHIGVRVGPYLLRGYDCPDSSFQLLNYPEYRCPIEIKKRSSGFSYQTKNYAHLPRVVILCLEHDTQHQHEHVDVLEVNALAKHLSS
jgi:hypothetical protein